MSPDEPNKRETENRIRDAMQSAATRHEPGDGWQDIEGRLGGEARPWYRLPGVVAGAAAVAVAAAVLAFMFVGRGGDEQSEQLEVAAPTTSTPTSGEDAASGPPPPVFIEGDFLAVAMLRDDRIEFVHGESGQTLVNFGQRIVPYRGVSDAVDFAVEARSLDAYVAVDVPGHGRCEPELRRYRGGYNEQPAPYDVVSSHGAYPVVSTDGSKLAYVEVAGSPADGCVQTLVVRDLDTGQEHRWAPATGDLPEPFAQPVIGMRWAPDSLRLAVERAQPDGSTDVQNLWVVDTTRASEDSWAADLVAPTLPSGADYWSLAGWSADGDLVLSTTCVRPCDDPVTVAVLDTGDDPAVPPQVRALYEIASDARDVSVEPNNSVIYLADPSGADTLSLHIPNGPGEEIVIDGVYSATWFRL